MATSQNPQAICRECKYKSLDRQTNGCLYGTGGLCPNCGKYLSFEPVIMVLGHYIPVSQQATLGAAHVAFLTYSDLHPPELPPVGRDGAPWAMDAAQLDELLASTKALIVAIKEAKGEVHPGD